ncbi:MAG: family 43 glycosylhydrolase, partial [Bacteroidales bacterium]|nr:family 43 glycosylhydrolase [Bacteroidales bacterium]
MKRICFLLLAIAGALILSFISSAQTSFGESSLFNDGWTFTRGEIPGASEREFDDSRWGRISLPHDWSIKGVLSPDNASCTGYLPAGIGWYRKHFSGTRLPQGKIYVYFEGVYNRSSVYLNGHLLGERPSGYASFLYDLTPYLDRKGDNVLAVRVDHSMKADSRFYTGSGIYRNVWLVSSGETHFALWGIGYSLKDISDRQAVVSVDTEIEGPIPTSARLSLSLKDASGKEVSRSSAKAQRKGTVDLKVPSPHRWDLDDPYLYSLEVTLVSGKEVLDRTKVNVGLRTLEFDADKGFTLNGKNRKIKGVCLHHDAGVLGAVVPEEVWERRLLALKSLGANAIRTAHNPQNPSFYDLCDRLGLLVMDEAFDEWEYNKKKWVEGWNVGTPSMDGTADFFNEWGERDLTDMVRRDRNHPSIFLWSIGNEVDYPNDPYSHPILDGDGFEFNQPISGGYKPDAPDAMRIGKIAKRLAAAVRSVDTSRPVTGALAGVVMSNETEYPEAVDVVGYNYTEGRYAQDHAKYPDRILYGSENGLTYESWKAVRDNDFIFGQFLWTGIDYIGESRAWPSRGFYSGILDLAGNRKPRAWMRAAMWSDEPVCYIGTYPKPQSSRNGRALPDRDDAWDTWNYTEGQLIRVVCYTNAAKARLLLDGEVVGEMTPFNDENGIIGWDVPYRRGVLTAEGYDESGKKVSEYTIHPSSRPAALRATADKTDIDAGGLVHVSIEVVDDDGNVVALGDNNITCTIEGPGSLLGLESADNTDMGDWTDNVQRAYRGRLLAYIRTSGNPGTVKVRFTSPYIEGAEVEIRTHRYTPTEEIRLSDPFVFADKASGMYYMTGTGGMLWKSPDLKVWDGPFQVADTDPSSWMGPRPMIWAAEIHQYGDKYYYFGTFTNQSEIIQTYRGNDINRRACHVLVGDSPEGPFRPMKDETYLPADQPTLDATLWVEDGKPYMIFCHEWLQNWN